MARPQPRPQYLRPLAPGVRERAAHAGRNGHAPYRPRMATKGATTTKRQHRGEPALFATYSALLRAFAIWLVLALALAALAGLLVLAAVWLGQHALLWIGGLMQAGGRGR